MPCRGLLVTGTDTGVGKTYLSCLIASWLREQGEVAGAYKPVCSGVERLKSGRAGWSDVEQLYEACGGVFPRERIAPQTFEAALAPPRAAWLEERTVNEKLIFDGASWWSDQVPWLIVEGAGGLLAPMAEKLSGADLAKELGFPVLIVARAGLGTINHTLLTIEVAKSRGLRLAGVIFNAVHDAPDDAAVQYNWEDLQAWTEVPILGQLRPDERKLRNRIGEKFELRWTELFDFSRSDD